MPSLDPASTPPAATLDGLQAGRAIAAIMVVIYHANNFILPNRLYEGEILWTGFGMGYAGVEFFFVLSGFIMFHVHRRDLGKPSRVLPFLRSRITRVYPTYWIVLTGLVAAYQFGRHLGPDYLRDSAVIFRSFLLLPSETRTLLPVAWTLQHEIFFYLLFAILVLDRRAGIFLFTLWLSACLWQMARSEARFPLSFLLSPYNLLFVIGILVAHFAPKIPAGRAPSLLVIGIAGFLFVGMTEAYLWRWPLALRCVAYGIPVAALVAGLARGNFRIPDYQMFLGNASYSIYLIHLPAMNAAAIILSHTALRRMLPMAGIFALLILIAILAGCALHVLIEQPLLARLRPRRKLAAA